MLGVDSDVQFKEWGNLIFMNIKYLIFIILASLLVAFNLSEGFTKEASSELGYTIINEEAKVPIKTPDFSERKVLKIRLDNGLQAILISDPKTDQSAATLTVGAGSWQDPDKYPGMAHFLEHMLFLGTKKYPKESEFQSFISEHGGSSNAFTTNDYTTYMFSVDNEAFPQALDRYAHFFKEPLFNPSGVSRELNAIDQEFAKNTENEDVRAIMVMKALENPMHPNSRFTMGNSHTLGTVSQETLRKWYEDHYSANIMRLMLISPLPLDDLVTLTVRDFGGIPNKNRQLYVPDVPLANPDLEGKLVFIEPIKNVRSLTLIWSLPQKFWEMKETRPDKLICHILGHEGKESLLAQLKREKLAEKLQCSTYDIGGKNLLLFVSIDLTDEGLQQVEHVVLRCFQTLARMKEKPFPQYIFDEVRQMDLINYEYQKREDAFETAMKIAEILPGEEIASFPEKTKMIHIFNPEDIQAFLDQLTPQNCLILIQAPATLTGFQSTHQEKWLNIPYAIKPIDAQTFEAWTKAKPINEITFPFTNHFIPQALEMVASTKAGEKLPLVPHPKLIVNNGNGQIYYALDRRYLIPKIYLYFNILTPEIEMGNPHKVVIGDLYVKGLEEALSRFSYPAAVAGLNFSVDRSDFGISIKITGYSDHAYLLFDEILKELKHFSINDQKFKLYKQALLRDYQNFNKEMPLKRVKEFFLSAIYKNYTKENQKAVALRKLSYAKFENAAQSLFNKSYVDGLIYGNLLETQAKEYADALLQTLNSKPFPKEEQQQSEVIVLPENKGPFLFETKIPSQGNAAMLAIEYPEYTFKLRAAQQILMTAMNEPFFSDLRTKQQTGYLVYSSGEEIERKLFNLFLVQSNTHDPRDLLARFELFIESFLQELGKTFVSMKNFETLKSSLLHELETPQKNLEEMGMLIQKLAFKYDGDFDWIDKRIEGLKELTYEEFLNFSHLYMGKTNKRRLAILLKGTIPEDKVFSYQRIGDLTQLKH